MTTVVVPFVCAASIKFCHCPGESGIDALTCVNCNLKAHEKCTEVLSFSQVSTANQVQFAITVSDLEKSGFNFYSCLSTEEKMKAVTCVLCENRLKGIKQRGEVPRGPKKPPPKGVKVSSQILHELHRLVAFQCQIFVFTQVEKLGKQQHEPWFASSSMVVSLRI